MVKLQDILKRKIISTEIEPRKIEIEPIIDKVQTEDSEIDKKNFYTVEQLFEIFNKHLSNSFMRTPEAKLNYINAWYNDMQEFIPISKKNFIDSLN